MKKFTSIITVLAILMAIAIIPASAAQVPGGDAEIQRYQCTSCSSPMRYAPYVTYTAWSKTGAKRDCMDGYDGWDIQYSRTKKSHTYVCEGCGNTMYTSTKEYKWECQGY